MLTTFFNIFKVTNRKDFIEIFELISYLIILDHPIILDIRWRFCEIASKERYGKEGCWEDRAEWEENLKRCCEYSLTKLVKALERDKGFRQSTIANLRYEVDRLQGKSSYNSLYWPAWKGTERFWSTWQENYERSAR